MTGYHIRLGYLSGCSGPADRAMAWEALKGIVLATADDTRGLIEEAVSFDAPKTDAWGCIGDYADAFRRRHDQTIVIKEPEAESDGEVLLLASGERCLKEHVRRAFCRIVIREMHKMNVEVSIVVA